MTEQLKAEAFVREARPALTEYQKVNWVCTTDCDWFCNKCKAGESNVPSSSIPNALICPKCKSNGDFISLPINLQDWLAVLGYTPKSIIDRHDTMSISKYGRWVFFDLTTGQPRTEANYKAFNDIVSI